MSISKFTLTYPFGTTFNVVFCKIDLEILTARDLQDVLLGFYRLTPFPRA
jgi:hypothetical protein